MLGGGTDLDLHSGISIYQLGDLRQVSETWRVINNTNFTDCEDQMSQSYKDLVQRLGTNMEFVCLFLAEPMACRRSGARDQTCTTAAAQGMAIMMLDP